MIFLKKSTDNFHNSIGPILAVAQCFGIMPVEGILYSDVKRLKFRWYSIRCIYSLILITLGFLEISLAFNRLFKYGLKLDSVGTIVFYSTGEIGWILFLLLAKEWPIIMNSWWKIEDKFTKLPYKLFIKYSINLKIKLFAIILILLSFGNTTLYYYDIVLTNLLNIKFFGKILFQKLLVEHLLYLATSITYSQQEIIRCNLTISNWENFFLRERSHLFDVFSFHLWMVPILETINVSMTFCWTFIDVFILMISIGISSRFYQISERISIITNKIMPTSFWSEIRLDFLSLFNYLQMIDKKISSLILLSCTSNLYFIATTLLNGFIKRAGILDYISHWYSITFVMSRLLCMLFCASAIDDRSRQILREIRQIPSKTWSLEVQRINDHIMTETLALSGKQFFFLTRKLIFAMAGTVITYELVLLDAVKEISGDSTCPIRQN